MPTILTDQVPLTGTDVSDATLYSLGLEWTTDTDGAWTGIRVYTPTTQPAADYQVVGYQVTSQSTGTEIARGTATWAAGGVWQTIPFATPVPAVAGVHYVAAYVTPDHFVLTNHGCDAAIVNGHLSSFANGDGQALNGRICVGADGFPDVGSGNAALYFADPVVDLGTSIALTLATEANTALQLGVSKTRALARAAETDTAQPITAGKHRALGLAGETDTAIAFGGRKVRQLGVAVELEEALPITRLNSRLVVRPNTGTVTRPNTGLVTRP